MPRQLKVYRTPIGFHDAYVAAPSKKAALEAWGSAKDLFARGSAELVTDPALTAEPLANPGMVVKRSRGSAAEQIAALPPSRPRPAAPSQAHGEQPSQADGEHKPTRARHAPAPPPAPRPPRPDRAALESAEDALAAAEARHRAEERALAAEEAALARRRKAQERAQAQERATLERARDGARRAYDKAIAAWRG